MIIIKAWRFCQVGTITYSTCYRSIIKFYATEKAILFPSPLLSVILLYYYTWRQNKILNMNQQYNQLSHLITFTGAVSSSRTVFLISWRTNDAQDVNEDVDNVKVQVESSKDVLFGRDTIFVLSSHHQLSIVNNIKREYKSSQGSITNHNPPELKISINFWFNLIWITSTIILFI